MKKMSRKTWFALLFLSVLVLSLLCFGSVEVLAENTDVATAIENTWSDAKEQIRRVTDNVIFPVIDVLMGIIFFVKLATAYLDFRKHGQFEWVPLVLIFSCLVFSLTCPLYLWSIIG